MSGRSFRLRNHSFRESFSAAWQGLGYALRRGKNIRFHFLAAYSVFFLALWSGFSPTEMVLVVAVSALVAAAELLNTAVEVLVDLASPSYSDLAKRAKDIAAGAVLVTVFGSLLSAFFLFYPHWREVLPGLALHLPTWEGFFVAVGFLALLSLWLFWPGEAEGT